VVVLILTRRHLGQVIKDMLVRLPLVVELFRQAEVAVQVGPVSRVQIQMVALVALAALVCNRPSMALLLIALAAVAVG
jgi:hypothetical protein